MSRVYRKARVPFIVGELRMKAWRTLEANLAQDDETWTARCLQYWNLQGELYGVQFSPASMLIDNDEGVVCTYAVVLEVLPGERTDDKERTPVEMAGVPSMRQ